MKTRLLGWAQANVTGVLTRKEIRTHTKDLGQGAGLCAYWGGGSKQVAIRIPARHRERPQGNQTGAPTLEL